MKSIIKDGVSIIQMPPHVGRVNNKTGMLGAWKSGEKYKGAIYYNGTRYRLGTHNTLEEIKEVRRTAETKKNDGTFLEWYAKTFPPHKNRFGVNGLSFLNDRKKYLLEVHYQRKKYRIGEFWKIEDAALVRKEADEHIVAGTFIKWVEEYKKNKRGRN